MSSLADRFDRLGFNSSASIDITTLRKLRFPSQPGFVEGLRSEFERIRSLEAIDEIEELELVLAHYAVSWAIRNGTPGEHLSDSFFLPKLSL